MHFARFAKTAALLLSSIGFALPAHAQNNKQIISGTFYEDRASANAGSNLEIVLQFTKTPADKHLNITNVSCDISVPLSGFVTILKLRAGSTPGSNDLGRDYSLLGALTSQTVVASTRFNGVVTNQVFFKLGPGRYPSIFMNPNLSTGSGVAGTTANCVIVGNLTDS